jgi:hypothetical protein
MLTTNVNLTVSGVYSAALDIGSVQYPLAFGANMVLGNGTGASQAQYVFTDVRTLTASASENLDLAGALADAFGATLTFTKVKALIIKADAANTNDVVVGGHASAAFASMFADATDKIKVKPGGTFMVTAPDANGLAVTATTADLLTVANGGSGTSVTYTVIIIGV